MDVNMLKFAIFVMPILEIILSFVFSISIIDVTKLVGITELILIPLYYSQKFLINILNKSHETTFLS